MEYPNITVIGNSGDSKSLETVIVHEVGHNYFPMIVNSDERQLGLMDEGLDTFVQYLTEQDFGNSYPESIGGLEKYPSRRGAATKIVP